jgi:hypothetical protein
MSTIYTNIKKLILEALILGSQNGAKVHNLQRS